MDLEFRTVGTVEDEQGKQFLVQQANVTNNKRFHILWNIAKKEDKEATSLGCELPDNLRRYAALRTVIVDGKPERFLIRQIPADSEFPELVPLERSYIPRDTSKLLPYQVRSFMHLCAVLMDETAAIDASDTGLGKTYVCAAVCRELRLRPIVICKKNSIDSWKTVLQSFGVPPYAIVNWEYAKRHLEFYKAKLKKWFVPPDALIVFDEAHLANHVGSQNSHMYIASKGKKSLSITATIADKPDRLAPLIYLLGAMTKKQFEDWRKKRGEFTDTYNRTEGVSDSQDMKILNRLIFPSYGYRLRYTDEDVRNFFPEAIYNTNLLQIGKSATDFQNKAYDKLLEELETAKKENTKSEFAIKKVTLELRYRQMAELLKVKPLVEIAKDLLQDGKSVIIFVNFRDTLKELALTMQTGSVIYGNQETDGISRKRVIDNFQANKTRLIISTVDAGGTSISLHDLEGGHQRVSLIPPTYNPTTLKQVCGRTYRAQSKSVPIIELVYAAKTIEEKIAETVNNKINNIAALNDGDLMEKDLFDLEH